MKDMKTHNLHWSEAAKARIIRQNTGCTIEEARQIADATAGFTYAMLEGLYKAVRIIKKGEHQISKGGN